MEGVVRLHEIIRQTYLAPLPDYVLGRQAEYRRVLQLITDRSIIRVQEKYDACVFRCLGHT